MDYNFWDDRTYNLDVNPCKGCSDYDDENEMCMSQGACAKDYEEKLPIPFT